jgi:Nucleotidyl transferase AbiEii toxin, Type IV TA system
MIDEGTLSKLKGNRDRIRRNATVVSALQKRTFRIQISKFEYCDAKTKRTFEHSTIYVYTPAMIALEKLRALCQQMPEYTPIRHKRPRARDFYDIYCILTEGTVNLGTSANLVLARNIFAAKQVPLSFISSLADHREFHRQDWPAVEDSVSGALEGFDFYFDFVLDKVGRLEALWVE